MSDDEVLLDDFNAPTPEQRRMLWLCAHGCLLGLLAFMVGVGLLLGAPYSEWYRLVLAHLIGGRPVNAGVGLLLGFNPWFVLIQSTMQDLVVMLYLYQFLIRGYEEALKLPVFGPGLARAHENAYKHRDKISTYGPIGLFAFVFVPLPGTGPIVGLFAGYLIGLTVFMTFWSVGLAVLLSTAAWVFGYHTLRQYDETIALYAMLGALALIVLTAVGLKVAHWRHNRRA